MMMRRLYIFFGLFLHLQASDIPGTININFGNQGVMYLEQLSDIFIGAIPTAILPMPDGSQYIACTVPNSYSFIAKLSPDTILDTNYGTNGISSSTNFGVTAIMMDGQGRLVLSGLFTEDFTAWISRYVAGDSGGLDSTFNDGFGVFHYDWIMNQVVQQTSSRYLAVGQDHATGYVTVWAFTDDGQIDTTFNSNGSLQLGGTVPGVFQIPVLGNVQSIVTDFYDRIYIAIRNSISGMISVVRLTCNGQIDTTFNTVGMVDVINGSDDQAQIRLVFDAAGNIVCAAHTSLMYDSVIESYISVAAINSDGDSVFPQYNISIPNNPTLTHFIATSDGKLLVAGYQFENNPMWIAQVTTQDDTYLLDTTFNPSGNYGDIPGVMQFSFEQAATSNLNSIAMYPNGQISILGTQTDQSSVGFISRAYDLFGITQEIVCQNSKPLGTNDYTFGILNPPANGIQFLAITRIPSSSGQAAYAVALQNDATFLVAIDGQLDTQVPDVSSAIYVNVFSIDGLLDTDFQAGFAPGQAIIVDSYQNQYVRDMIAFTGQDGLDKALFTGYVTNANLGSNNLLLAQYIVTPESPGLDQSFGGYNGDPLGIVLGTGSSQGFTIGRQSMGRIITCGFDPGNSVGMVQAYTPTGLLDDSFGVGGYFTQGFTGIYVAVIDSLDRILVAYNDTSGNLILARILADGSGLDQTFGIEGTFFIAYNDEGAAPLSSNNSFRVVLNQDGTIYVVAVLLEGTVIAVNQIDADAQEGIIASSSFYASNFGGTLDNFQIGSLLINQNNHLVVTGADNDSILMMQVVQDDPDSLGFLQLDSHFNTSDTPGYIRYNIDDNGSGTIITDGLIHPDGRYLIVGYKPMPVVG